MNVGIYGFKNKIDGKWYIGQSVHLDKRRKNHLMALRGDYHDNIHLQRAFNKYTQNAFEYHILELCDRENLNEKEMYYISLYKSNNQEFGYNLDGGGNIGAVTEEHRLKISKANKGRPAWNKGLTAKTDKRVARYVNNRDFSDLEVRKRIGDGNRGKVMSEEARRKMSLAKKGKPLSREHKKNLSIASINLWKKQEFRQKITNIKKRTKQLKEI